MNYITAAQARELGAGNAEYFQESEGWMVCDPFCYYAERYKYRAIKQAQPEPVDPHAALRAEYAKQVAEGTTGFYLWEVLEGDTWKKRDSINNLYPVLKYRFTDLSCYVSKDGKPAIRMLKAEARELQRNTKHTHDWFVKGAGKDFHELTVAVSFVPLYAEGFKYELRLKQPVWTGSRDDVLALLKEKGVVMNESQKTFEAAYPYYDHRLGVDGKYHSRVSQDAYTYFTKGVAYGRKQATERAELLPLAKFGAMVFKAPSFENMLEIYRKSGLLDADDNLPPNIEATINKLLKD
jgi:hypothetical protein